MAIQKKRLKHAAIVAAAVALALALAATVQRKGEAQQAPTQLSLGLYAPSAAFADAAARLAYVQGLAKAIQTATGITTSGKAYVSLAAMQQAKPDFAIVEGLCVAAKAGLGSLLAVASVGGDTKQAWALYTRGDSLVALKGKKIAYVKTGCNDLGFMDNAVLLGEVKAGTYFGGLVDKVDVAGTVVTVRDLKQADGVFAPAALAKGLTRITDGVAVPTPGFLQVNKALPAATVKQVQTAVLAYGAGGGIDGWRAANQAAYQALNGNMGAHRRSPVFAQPDKVDINDQDVIVVPQSSTDQATIKQHFWEPPPKR